MPLCGVQQPSQESNGSQPFPGAEAYGKIPAHDSSGSRRPYSHSYTRELKITANSSIFVTSVHCRHFSFSVLQKLEMTKTERFHLMVQDAPSCSYLDEPGFFKNTGNMAHLKFANPFGHKVISLFHIS